MRVGLLIFVLALPLHAQWEILDGRTTADLRGVDNVGKGVVWVSGTNGTVMRSEDDGYMWQGCTVPTGAEKLDFRGIQAFDNNTAIVMSSGPGDASRLYKTTDGCQTWKLVFTNPDKDGFFDAVQKESSIVMGVPDPDPDMAVILGDSVNGEIRIWEWQEKGEYCDSALHDPTMDRQHCPDHDAELLYEIKGRAEAGEGSFAASNSVFQVVRTPQSDPTWKYEYRWASNTGSKSFMSMVLAEKTNCEPCRLEHRKIEVPMSDGTSKAGIFSFQFNTEFVGVAVGGNYEKANEHTRTAAFTKDGGNTWKLSATLPHGYRSAVAYDAATKAWITVGPNGTDVSLDDGRNWRAVRPDMKYPDAQADEDQKWNALSLPFVVGPKGRIGKWRGLVIATASR